MRDLSGIKIRTVRLRLGLTQGELARRSGISPSYLNLIEQNKRMIAGGLLDRIAAGLGVERAALDGEAERRIVDEVKEIAADPALQFARGERGPAEEFVGRHPGWADFLIAVYRAYRRGRQDVVALADRLNRDPFLGDSVHRMLTKVASIRSAAEIVEQDAQMSEADRARFLAIVGADSAALSETAKALVDFFDSNEMRIRATTPTEKVDALLFNAQNHFPGLESYAEAHPLHDAAEPAYALQSETVGAPLVSAETRRFIRLRDAVARGSEVEISRILDAHEGFAEEAARTLAVRALASYTAAAILMPYERFREAAERHRYDVDILARLFGVSYEQAAHRLTTMRRPGREGIRFAFMRSDASGFITKRLPLPRLPLPRYGHGCPVWPVYGAFQTPGVTARAIGELPSGEAFLFFARAVEKGLAPAGRPRNVLSLMLVCQAADAARVAAADGLDRSGRLTPVGTACRLCPREGCAHRQEPRLLA